MEGNVAVDPARLLARGRREVQTEVGTVIVRRVPMSVLAKSRGQVLDVQNLLKDRPEGEMDSPAFLASPQAQAMLDGTARIICAGVLEPKLFLDPKDGPTPLDFSPQDEAAILSAILELSGWTRAAAEEVRP